MPDIICLGEIDAESSDFVLKNALPRIYTFDALDVSGSRPQFQMSIFWNSRIFDLTARECAYDSIGAKTRKTYMRTQFSLRSDASEFGLYLVHWPSRLRESEETRMRGDLAQSLRRVLDRDLADRPDRYLIVLGDFNDNPYDLSLTRYLRATRDLNLAKSKPELIYNPFWSALANAGRFRKSDPTIPTSGSYYRLRSDETHHWHVFDQILVSHSLLGTGSWSLNEVGTGVLDQSNLHGISLAKSRSFDHYPVIALFEKDEWI